MFTKLLVGTDGSDSAAKAVAQAATIAKAIGAELIAMTAFSTAPADTGGPLGREAGVPPQDLGRSVLEDVRKRYGDTVALRALLKEGDPADALIDIAEEEKVDLIVVGNRGMTGPKRFVLGSVPNNVSHHAPTSLLIVDTTSDRSDGRRDGLRYSKVLVATDGSPTAGKAAETGAQLAASLGAEILLLSVGSEAKAGPVLEQSAKYLAQTGAKITTKVVGGDPADMIVETAEREGVDLVVVGNRGMTGSKRFILGSVPNHVSHHSPCDVLIVRTT